MRVEYSKRAVADLRKIGAYYRDSADALVALAVERRIREVVARIGRSPESASPVINRQNLRVMLVLRYPYSFLSRD
jgi:plasmid stabilization system protein ParE